jgi:hypothetical protein
MCPLEHTGLVFGRARIDPFDDLASQLVGHRHPVARVAERIERAALVRLLRIVKGDSGRVGKKRPVALVLDPDRSTRKHETVLCNLAGSTEIVVRGSAPELADLDECRPEQRSDRIPSREHDFDNATTTAANRISPEDVMGVNYYAVAAAAISTFIIGGLWYSPVLFQRPWMAANGLEPADLAKSSPVAVFGVSLLLALVMAVNLAMFLAGPDTALRWGATAGALTGLGWVAPALATVALFERRSWRYIAINGGYWIASFTTMGAILGAWR